MLDTVRLYRVGDGFGDCTDGKEAKFDGGHDPAIARIAASTGTVYVELLKNAVVVATTSKNARAFPRLNGGPSCDCFSPLRVQ